MKALIAENTLIDGRWQENVAVTIQGGKIQSVADKNQLDPQTPIEELGDGYLVPGFFDIQVNGGGGVLLNDDPTVKGIKAVADAHRQYGTTSLLPTLISDSWDVMQRMAAAVEEARVLNIPGIQGVHFEGPYLNKDRKGVHNPSHIRDAETKFIDLIDTHELGVVLVTLAPERVSGDFIRDLISAGAVVSAGHTTATYEQARQALQAGLTGFTHLYNAMPPFLSREPGVIGAALERQEGYCGIIVDGLHVHPATLKAAIAAKGTDRIILVTDAMPPVGTDMQSFQLQGREIIVKDGCCMTEGGTLAGSSLTMEQAVRNSCSLLGCVLEEAVTMATTIPARFMGIDQKIGSIKVGANADFVLLSEHGAIRQVI